MSIKISQIKNEEVRKAAEAADSYGNQANNGILNDTEISVFIRCAMNNNLSTESILSVIGNDSIDTDNITALKKINKLEQKLIEKEESLKKANEVYKAKFSKYTDGLDSAREDWGSAGMVLGGVIGVFAGVSACVFMPPVGAAAEGIIAAFGLTGGALGGGSIGKKLAEKTGEAIYKNGLTAEERQILEEGKKMYENTIVPLEKECAELRKQIAEIKSIF